MKHFFTLALVLAVLSSTGCQKDITAPYPKPCIDAIANNAAHPMKDSLQAIIDRYIAKGIPGIQVVVKNNKGWHFTQGGYASLETKNKIEPCSTGWLFSITKTYTAVLVMKQQEKSKINLDAPIRQYLPAAVANGIEGSDKVTVRMLLNHSSGIINHTSLPEYMGGQLNDPTNQPTVDQLLQLLYGKSLMFEPGTDFKYSNSNYLLLQVILENVTGKSYGHLLETEILQPLQLKQTYFYLAEGRWKTLGFPSYYLDRYAKDELENVSRWNGLLANASYAYGGIAATAADAIRFYENLVTGKVVTNASWQEMRTWKTGKESTQPDYGLGLEYFQYAPGSAPQFGHEGDGIGNSTLMLYVPDNNTYLFVNCTVSRQIFGPFLFKITDFKNELSAYVAKWRP